VKKFTTFLATYLIMVDGSLNILINEVADNSWCLWRKKSVIVCIYVK